MSGTASTQRRQPRGVPTGGEFARNDHVEADSPLSVSWSDLDAEGRQERTREMVLDALDAEGKSGWTVEFVQLGDTLGRTNHTDKIIQIDPRQLFDEARTRDTAMHEVAHVAAGHAASHGPVWKAHARRLGATPRAGVSWSEEPTFEKPVTVKTGYGPVPVVLGKTEIDYGGRRLVIVESRRGFLVGRDTAGALRKVSMDAVHPDYGDVSKMIPRTARLQGKYGPFEITVGRSSIEHGGDTYVAVEPKRSTVIAVSESGRRLQFEAHLFDAESIRKQEALSDQIARSYEKMRAQRRAEM